ncbi:MAG: KpsF/GutQ family sugar-phosphate isomerase [Deltaproteobacteria bacterium]|nr:KpsF/GutQ family sugar-phosphate isomerase [Deltaproteobacteria bacterium]
MTSVESGRRVLRIEAEALTALADGLGPEFDRAVELLEACRGKVILTGMGKSGLVCKKIAATMASTGTPAFFLHPAEGVHGDLGILARGDVVVAASHSGETEELLEILPVLRRLDLRLVAITGNRKSTLAARADVVLYLAVEREACPLNLAPMASTTATLALGDALAAALMERRGFSPEDFAQFHPAGSLGRQLTLQVDDLMRTGDAVPRVFTDTPMREAILEITGKGLGFTGVFEATGALVGIVTDGDLRRCLQQGRDFLDLPAATVMTSHPKAVLAGTRAIEALRLMEKHAITSLFVAEPRSGRPVAGRCECPAPEACDEEPRVVGVVHIHDLVRAGLR